MTFKIPTNGNFLILNVSGIDHDNKRVKIPEGSTITWFLDNPVIVTMSTVISTVDTVRKLVAKQPGLTGFANVQCTVSFEEDGKTKTFVKTFNIEVVDNLP